MRRRRPEARIGSTPQPQQVQDHIVLPELRRFLCQSHRPHVTLHGRTATDSAEGWGRSTGGALEAAVVQSSGVGVGVGCALGGTLGAAQLLRRPTPFI